MLRRSNDDEERLRRIIINSADALPERVASYLIDIAAQRAWPPKTQALREYRPLVDHLPHEFVDFALAVLLRRSSDDDAPTWRTGDSDDLGIGMQVEFYPPAHVQGPFLALLRGDEDEGLRLVHGLANKATENWRQLKRLPDYSGQRLTPIPIVVNLPTEHREFWGDEEVYLWYRTNSRGPAAITSALMALEVWMEEQIGAGRNAEQLFEKVLSGSICVAVVGVALSVALAHEDRCLRAAVPLVTVPMIWVLDIARHSSDMMRSVNGDWGQHRWLFRLRQQRDTLPQRSTDVTSLAASLALSSDESTRIPFEQALAAFPENLPFHYEEEATDPSKRSHAMELMMNYRGFADRRNYRWEQVGNGWRIWYQPPEDVVALNADSLGAFENTTSWLALLNWATDTMERGSASTAMTVEQAVEAARSLQRPDDFRTLPVDDGPLGGLRLEAIATTASAALHVSFSWVRDRGLVIWCRDTLLAAAAMPRIKRLGDQSTPYLPVGAKVASARGLAALVQWDVADEEVRDNILDLIASEDPRIDMSVTEAVFQGLRLAWPSDEVLGWNALALGLSLCVPPMARVDALFVREGDSSDDNAGNAVALPYKENLQQDVMPSFPQIDEDVYPFDCVLAPKVLAHLPLATLLADPVSKSKMLSLLDNLVAWTIKRNEHARNERYSGAPFQWNHFFLYWMTTFAPSLTFEEIDRHVLTPVLANLAASPDLTRDLMEGYILNPLMSSDPLLADVLEGWERICATVFENKIIAGQASSIAGNDEIIAILGLVVFVRFGRSIFNNAWPHASRFTSIIDTWVGRFGSVPRVYADLVLMLAEPGWPFFMPEPALEWLSRCLSRSTNAPELWHTNQNGDSTAQIMQRMWTSHADRISDNAGSLRRFSEIVDSLVNAGVRLAVDLQHTLEGRSQDA
jgi:hypothetical protein